MQKRKQIFLCSVRSCRPFLSKIGICHQNLVKLPNVKFREKSVQFFSSSYTPKNGHIWQRIIFCIIELVTPCDP
jgi:hypothetical protein